VTVPLEARAPDRVVMPFPDRGMRSGIYEGTVVHHRTEPVDHRFSYRITMTMLDLAEIEAVCGRHPLWSAELANAVSFRRRDYLGDPAVPLDRSVRDLVEERTGHRPIGPISLLTQVRTWGWLFNPISCYFCYDDAGAVEAMVPEVTNTPWHERHAYVVGSPGTHWLDKSLHVSPFFPMDQRYRLHYTAPGPRLSVSFSVEQAGDPVLFAGVSLERQEVTRAALGSVVWRPGRSTLGVSAGIYHQALALKRKGATFHPHPAKAAGR
jgi:hypothetical protein